jgi:hypothetical protein
LKKKTSGEFMQSINRNSALRPRETRRRQAAVDETVYVARWLRHLSAELSCAQGLAVPLEGLLLRWAGRVQPQHMFDGLRHLLEAGEAELELVPGGYVLALARPGVAAPRYVTRGELVVLASAIAEVQPHGENARRMARGRPR